MDNNSLKEIGLTDKELTIYQLLIASGEMDAAMVIKETGFKRPTVYKALGTLGSKGLVTSRADKLTTYFTPENPQKLLSMAEEQFSSIQKARNEISNLVPILTSSYLLSVEKPIVTTFTGVSGLKKIYEDTLKEGKPIYALLKLVDVNDELENWLEKVYVKKRAEIKIPAKVIVSAGEQHSYIARSDNELRETKVVKYADFSFEHEVNIYGDKLAFIDYSKDGPMIGIVINHPLIARTAKAWFDLAWKNSNN